MKSALTSSLIVSQPSHPSLHFRPNISEVSDNFGYGCALLSESKYGWAVEGQTIRLSLLRAPTAPDPDADQGQQNFSFAIYPHEGTFAQSDVADVAYAFNTPMTCELGHQFQLALGLFVLV